jgi:hypothetical protein
MRLYEYYNKITGYGFTNAGYDLPLFKHFVLYNRHLIFGLCIKYDTGNI